MTEHKAKPEQWAADRYDWHHADTEALHGDTAFRCIMELRDRVEALEAAQRPTVKPDLTVPSSSLMEEVVDAITDASAAYGTADEPARAAILAVVDWLDQQELHDAATRLRMEVG